MTERIQEFLRNRRSEGQDTEPCLVVDLEVVRDNYQTFAKALPDSRVFYAVKANPAPEVLSLLASMGSCFDTASVAEIDQTLVLIAHDPAVMGSEIDGPKSHFAGIASIVLIVACVGALLVSDATKPSRDHAAGVAVVEVSVARLAIAGQGIRCASSQR